MESDDDGSFLSAVKKRPRIVASAGVASKKQERMVLSIQSSDDDDDDDDDDDIATLRASQSFVDNGNILLNGNDDDITIEKLHETQEAHHSTPWSPLTASPFTPQGALMNASYAKNDRRVSNIPKNMSITASAEVPPCCDISTAVNDGRRGLNLSKVRLTTNQARNGMENEKDIILPRVSNGSTAEKQSSLSNTNVMYTKTLNSVPGSNKIIHKTINTAVTVAMATTTSVLESTTIMNQSPPNAATKKVRAEKKRSLPTNTIELNIDVIQSGRPESDKTPLTTSASGQNKASDVKVKQAHQKKNHSTTETKRTDDTVTTLAENNIKVPDKKTKKSALEFTKTAGITNKENVVEPLLNNTKETKQTFIKSSADDPPPKKKKTSKSIEKKDDAKSTTTTSSSKVTVPKPKKLTFQEQVMVHMLNALKPFTLKLLSEEMKTSEASVNFVLLSLVDKGLVVQKDFASNKGRVKTLYWANHDAKAKEVKVGITDNTLASKEERDAVHRQMLDLRNEIATIRNHYQQVIQTPSNDDLTHLLTKQESELQELYRSREEVQERIRMASTTQHATTVPPKGFKQTLSKTSIPSFKIKCPIRLKKRINHLRDEWKTRKTKCMDFIEQLADGLEKRPKDVLNLCDIDTDEMNHVILPAKYPM